MKQPEVPQSPGDLLDNLVLASSVQFSGAAVIRIVGDSMRPALFDGDRVLIDRSAQPAAGDVVSVRIEGNGHIVGVWRTNGRSAWLEKRNPDYTPVALPPGRFSVDGVARKIVGRNL